MKAYDCSPDDDHDGEELGQRKSLHKEGDGDFSSEITEAANGMSQYECKITRQLPWHEQNILDDGTQPRVLTWGETGRLFDTHDVGKRQTVLVHKHHNVD